MLRTIDELHRRDHVIAMGWFSSGPSQTPKQRKVKQQRLNKQAKAHNQSLFAMKKAGFPAVKPPKKK